VIVVEFGVSFVTCVLRGVQWWVGSFRILSLKGYCWIG